MKRRVWAFVAAVVLGMSVVPVVNGLSTPAAVAAKWQDSRFWFNMDGAFRLVSKALYPFGISLSPDRVVIGKDGWLFLGDHYSRTLSADRREASPEDAAYGARLGEVAEVWDAYFRSQGVRLFKILIGPNKGSVYAEHMPAWARPPSPGPTDAVLEGAHSDLLLDVRADLRESRTRGAAPLYYLTDTHWNNFGAGLAFRAMAQRVGPQALEITWPPDDIYRLQEQRTRGGGDLSAFLRLKDDLSDVETMTAHSPSETTGEQVPKGTIERVHTPDARNQKRVLWIQDSFGGAMSRLMTTTFADVLRVPLLTAQASPGTIEKLVQEFRPDYVFITVVERTVRDGALLVHMPSFEVPADTVFTSLSSLSRVETHQSLDKVPGPVASFLISGGDPNMVLPLPTPVNTAEVHYLKVDLRCADGSPEVPVQLFWQGESDPGFYEGASVSFALKTGTTLVDLRRFPNWRSAGVIRKIRLDADQQGRCQRFDLGQLALGS